MKSPYTSRVIPSFLSVLVASAVLTACGGSSNGTVEDAGITIDERMLATTDNYIVEYIPEASGEGEGHNTFILEIRDLDGNLASGKQVSLKPLMTMVGGHVHGTPVGHIEERDDYYYQGDIYYLMPGGPTMGEWKLSFCIGNGMAAMDDGDMNHGDMDMSSACADGEDEAVFYPLVAGRPHVKGTLKGGDNDQIPGMSEGTQARTYHFFKHSTQQHDGSYHAHVYIAATESMMSFPGLSTEIVLNAGTETQLEINEGGLQVEFSGDDGQTWVDATNAHGGGLWAANMNGMASSLRVKLSVNGEVKTETGASDDEFNYVTLAMDDGMDGGMGGEHDMHDM